jgi:hypothetical protein
MPSQQVINSFFTKQWPLVHSVISKLKKSPLLRKLHNRLLELCERNE